MNRSRFVCLMLVCLLCTLTTFAFAGGGRAQPLSCTMTSFTVGVSPDASDTYVHSGTKANPLRCYFGVGGKDFDLVTYDSGRTFHYRFDGTDPDTVSAVTAAGLPGTDFFAESDAFGINYWGRFKEMAVGATANVQMDLEFHIPNNPLTYELDYSTLAVTRLTATQWLLTSEPEAVNNGGSFGGAGVSSLAKLNVIRRRNVQNFGTVDMPIRIEMTLLP